MVDKIMNNKDNNLKRFMQFIQIKYRYNTLKVYLSKIQ
jgi:hypothetical protein